MTVVILLVITNVVFAKQDWCPNPECGHSVKGCKFEPHDDLRKWFECKCGTWFKTKEIMDAHREISVACKDIIV
ncbi:MAG: hypothetical protein E6K97_09695 [Thaumarchaeota archaeon]|nr:MAG: hypothetical protein E6K97_09695 [Nitrososphaerota archaeon]